MVAILSLGLNVLISEDMLRIEFGSKSCEIVLRWIP